MDKGFESNNRMTKKPSDVQWGAAHFSSNPPVTTYSKPSPSYSGKYERTNMETTRHPGKRKGMSDDYSLGSRSRSKKKSSSSRYPWLGGNGRKMSW